MKEKTKPTFSILCDTEENTNLAINEVIKISLEEGIIDQAFLDSLKSPEKIPVAQ